MRFHSPMSRRLFAGFRVSIAFCLVLLAQSLLAQNSILVFNPVDQRASAAGTGNGASAVDFNSNTLSLTCTASPIAAILSSTADSTGNLLVDNNINVTVASGSTTTGPTNICVGGVNGSSIGTPFQNCFNSSYEFPPSGVSYLGRDPDTFAATGGVPPISIANLLVPGTEQVTISLQDEGFNLASTTIYLNTNCTQNGVTGPALVNGNPIPATSPTTQQLSQDFGFNSSANQQIGFEYDLTAAQSAGSLTITDGTIPQVVDLPIDPSTFQKDYVSQTSFATSNCLIHTGELLPNGQPACKLFTLQCAVGSGATASGAQCPVSTQTNEIFQDVFNGPAFALADIPTPNGPTFHEGIGFLMASDGWAGGACVFDSAADLGDLDCPQNLLTSFTSISAAQSDLLKASSSSSLTKTAVKQATGDAVHTEAAATASAAYASSGRTTHPNSTFITVVQVPEPLTTVTFNGATPKGPYTAPAGNYQNFWFRTNPVVTLSTQPPNLAGTGLAGAANFVPSPIASVTYGISDPLAIPTPGAPIAGDVTLTNSTGCPTPPNLSTPPASVFTPGQQTLNGLAEGIYTLHYYAQDCAGTEELQFNQDTTGNWSTAFYTMPFGIDRTPPFIRTDGPESGVFQLGQITYMSYQCVDVLSGVEDCNGQGLAVGGGDDPKPNFVQLNTRTPGPQTITLTATDFAGNETSVSYQYYVESPAVDSQVQVSASPTSTTYPGNILISSTIVPGTSPTHAPTGTVQLFIDGSAITTLSLSGAGHGYTAAYYELLGSALNAGQHNLYALYSGDSRNPPGASALLYLTVQPAPVTLSISCVNPKIPLGANFSCGVFTKPVAAGASGIITYQYDSAAPVAVPLSGGAASFTIPAPAPGSHTIVVSYPAQLNYTAAPAQTVHFTVVPPS
jgi:hypothetical protein